MSDIHEVPCLSCQHGYGRAHHCDIPDYCACDQTGLHSDLAAREAAAPAHDGGLRAAVEAVLDDFRARADEAARRELSDRNAYARRAAWDRASELVAAALSATPTPTNQGDQP